MTTDPRYKPIGSSGLDQHSSLIMYLQREKRRSLKWGDYDAPTTLYYASLLNARGASLVGTLTTNVL